MNADVRESEPAHAEPAGVSESRALAHVSEAERRVQLAKARLTQRLSALDQRARYVVKQSAWLAGAVLLGLAGAAITVAMTRGSSRGRAGRSGRGGAWGMGAGLMLGALGLMNRQVRSWQLRLGNAYERSTTEG